MLQIKTLLAANCTFCKRRRSSRRRNRYTVSDVDTYDEYTNQIDPYVIGIGLAVSAVSAPVIVLSQKWLGCILRKCDKQNMEFHCRVDPFNIGYFL